MINKYRDKLDEEGVSPVIGVILLVAVTVALVALATVIVFDIGSGVSDTSDASVQMEQTDSGVQATIVRNENVDEFILRHEDGTEKRSTKSIGSFTYDNGDGEYTLIGVVGGNEEVIGSKTVVGAESGESSSVIEVGNLTQLQAMQGDLSAEYKLIRDIDASETETWNEITSDEFKTSLSNGDTTELNLVDFEGTINVVDSTGTDVAFTSNTNNDLITINDTAIDTPQDLTISYDLETPINQGFDPVGTYDYFEQANTEFTGSFDGQNHTISNLSINRLDYVGLFGRIDSSAEVENVGVINVNITGESYVGGLVGYNDEGTVSNSYSTGNVTGEDYVGGLVGDNYNGNISNSYSTGNVSGYEYVGGLLGLNYGTVSNSYWDTEATGQSSSDGGNGLTTSEMQGSSAKGNMNFDVTSTWSTVTGDYPELQE